MIHFECPQCAAGLRVSDDKAGKLVRCPGCGATPRAPAARPQEVEELPVVEDEEIAKGEAAEDDEDRPPAPRRKRRQPVVDEEGGEREFVTRNRIMGAVGVLIGLGFTIGALCTALAGAVDFRNPLTTPYNCGGCLGLLLGVLLIVVGVIYAIRG